jgi:APA family basic amino acid/polyamine antiporter
MERSIATQHLTVVTKGKTKAAPTGELKKVLGMAFGIAIVVGNCIGVGILRNPGSIAAMIPSYWIILGCWLLCGLIILLTAGSYAELNVLIPKEGGPYNYVKQAFGNYHAFVIGWLDCIGNAILPATLCISIGEFIKLLFPSLPISHSIIALAVLGAVTFINYIGTNAGSGFQKITSLIKILLFAFLIAACFLLDSSSNFHTVEAKSFVETVSVAGLFILFLKSFQLMMGTYGGWQGISFFAEEDANPSKNIPRSYFSGIAIIITIYVLVNAALFYVVPVATAVRSPLLAADAANILFGEMGQKILVIFFILSLVSILNARIMIVPRILYGLGRDGFFISQATKVNKGGTPEVSMMLAFALQVVLIFNSSFPNLFKFAAFPQLLLYIFSLLSLIRLRKKWPSKERSYRAWGYPYSTIICLFVYTALLIGFGFSDPKNAFVFLAVTAALVLFYKGIVNKHIAAKTT